MAKKQFIRHLEFYGFPDQNGYSSDINGVDLSDIRQKNKEQDEEIADLEGEKADKRDLASLSGTVENFITRQSEINQEFADVISGMSNDIEELKDVDNEFATQLSALTEGINSLNEEFEDFSGNTSDAIETLNANVEELIAKSDTYALKEDTYTKQEVDNLISGGLSGYATEEWVIEQGYLTEASGDSRYAKIEDVNNEITQLTNDINAVDGKVDTLSSETKTNFDEVNEKINAVEENISVLSGGVEVINSQIGVLESEINDNAEAIDALGNIVSGNTNSIEDLYGKVNTNTSDINDIRNILDTKANISDLQDLQSDMVQGLNNLENKKADKVDLAALSGTVSTIREDLDAEITRSTNADAVMQGEIDGLGEDIQEVSETVGGFEDRIAAVESGLTKEISDREQADLALIGTSGDSITDNTIFGAKKFAKEMRRQAIESAKTYTDDRISEFDGELENLEERIEQQMTKFATEDFVISACNDTEAEIRGEFGAALNREVERAERAETNLEVEIQGLASQIVTNIEKISHNASRINAITSWEGTDPEQYDDSGNGILDVLHREFHEFERTHGTIKSIEVVDGNLIITYETIEGEKQEIIPLSELIVLDDYYTKEETNDLLDEKTDLTLFNALIEKLGYTNNETLERRNEHEVAFGSYNVSSTDSEASGQTIFSVGIGTSDEDRKNALEVRNDGSVYMWVEGDFMNVNKLLAQIAHEVYDTDSANNPQYFDGD